MRQTFFLVAKGRKKFRRGKLERVSRAFLEGLNDFIFNGSRVIFGRFLWFKRFKKDVRA